MGRERGGGGKGESADELWERLGRGEESAEHEAVENVRRQGKNSAEGLLGNEKAKKKGFKIIIKKCCCGTSKMVTRNEICCKIVLIS